MNKKAIIMLSGGLDSSLAAKIMLDQGIELIGLNFTSIFCTCTSYKKKESGCQNEALRIGKELGITVKTLVKGIEYFKIVESPKFGYGKGINPCLDCRIYILKKAKDFLQEYGSSFIVTGEVLGQRPMSQMRHHLKLIEREVGLEGLIVRPLSAKFLEPTIPEKVGIVNREKLLAISGRSRKEQIRIAKDINFVDYPCPSGGCLLTDKIFAKRIKDLFLYKKNYNIVDLKLLKIGRHFRISDNCKIIVGRNERENKELENFTLLNDYLIFVPIDTKGPSILLAGEITSYIETVIKKLFFRYSDVNNKDEILVKYKSKKEEKELKISRPIEEIELTLI